MWTEPQATRERSRPAFGPQRIACALLSGLLLGMGVPALAQSRPESLGAAQIQRLTETFRVESGQPIHVSNRFGNVRIREVPLVADAELALTIQVDGELPHPVRPRVETLEDGSIHVGAESDVALSDQPGFLRMDLTLALPDRGPLHVELGDGDFTMHEASYSVRVRADRGSIRLRTSGEVDVEVRDGHVVYLPPRGRSPAGGRIQSSGAPVDVLMNDPRLLDFSIVSGAAVTTDSPRLLQRRRIEGRTVVFDGPAESTLEIQTDHAPVRLVFEGLR